MSEKLSEEFEVVDGGSDREEETETSGTNKTSAVKKGTAKPASKKATPKKTPVKKATPARASARQAQAPKSPTKATPKKPAARKPGPKSVKEKAEREAAEAQAEDETEEAEEDDDTEENGEEIEHDDEVKENGKNEGKVGAEEANESSAEQEETSEERMDTDNADAEDKTEENTTNENTESAKNKQQDDSLVISTGEDEELMTSTTEEGKKTDDKSKKSSEEKKKDEKKKENKSVWVSNISRSTKAAELKKMFSKHGKVTTARIVTNGKSYFGYISLDTSEMATNCVKFLHNSKLDGRSISVSFQRPDLKESAKPKDKKDDKKEDSGAKIEGDKSKEKTKGEDAEKKAEDSKDGDAKKKDSKPKDKSDKNKKDEKKPSDSDRLIKRLKRDLEETRRESLRYKRRFSDVSRRLLDEETKSRNLRKDVDRLEDELRHERRKLQSERESYEKKRKLDDIRFEADKAMLNKEIDECKKLREYLQSKINELSGPGSKSRHRSRSRSPRSSLKSRPSRPGLGGPRDHRYDGKERSPPPPPKLSSAGGRPSPRRGERERTPEYMMRKKMRSEGVSHNPYQTGNSNMNTRPLLPVPNDSREGQWGGGGSFTSYPLGRGGYGGGQAPPQASYVTTAYPGHGGSGSGYGASLNQGKTFYNDFKGGAPQRRY